MKDWNRPQQLLAALLFPVFTFWVCVTTGIEHVVLWIDLIDHHRLPLLRGYKLRTLLDMDCTPKTLPALFLGILLLPPCASVLLLVAILNIGLFLLDLLFGARGVHAFDRYRMWMLRNIFIPVANGEKNLLCNMCKLIKKYDIIMVVDDQPTETQGSLDLRTQQIPVHTPSPYPNSSSSEPNITGSSGGSNSTYPSGDPVGRGNNGNPPPPPTPVELDDGPSSLRSRLVNLVETEV
ncbi:protein E27 [Elephant endotheliotropic herpesvirus 1A]|uniref:Membrane protein EE20 n=2 Tax=Elephantid herpesvirus 1 TaxID=146015 RepID=M4JTS9_ELHV1|nr:membrane protein EE20 [Elephantid betaherpesvirus 1]AGG16049.2 protein E27 [Elephant endotheliotropic herpesvirus 1A]AGE09902.2 membrane protein EE20 [Elephantid betaherpesvirus 1]AGE10011.2 membrane protein EE20 [Elephantid betaherpesvirus 1]QOE74673.1 protein E27 [Elephant endotheliotropic herpesvirus 1A]QOE74793.1 protein E27 [Elephant endotheliotropic herpesvirus 1A]